MLLLMEYSQKRKVFSLWAKYEIFGEDLALVEKYNIDRFKLVEGNVIQDWGRALKLAGALSAVVFAVIFILASVVQGNIGAGVVPGTAWAAFVFVPAIIAIYYKIRETVTVADILKGRQFACRSILTLLEKKEHLTQMAEKFADFMEALKNWGGREIIDLAPGQSPSARFVEKPHATEAGV